MSRHRDPGSLLTYRQREALVMKANGYSDQQVADALNITRASASSLLLRTYRMLSAHSATQAVAIALKLDEIGVHQIALPEGIKEVA